MLNADRQADIANLLNVEPGHDPESMRLWAERVRVELTYLVESQATIDALTRERDEALAKVERLQLHVEMHEERTDAAEERATRAEHANRRLADRYHHLMPNHGTTPLLRDICQCGRDNLAAAERTVREQREALEQAEKEWAVALVAGTNGDPDLILAVTTKRIELREAAALAPDTKGEPGGRCNAYGGTMPDGRVRTCDKSRRHSDSHTYEFIAALAPDTEGEG